MAQAVTTTTLADELEDQFYCYSCNQSTREKQLNVACVRLTSGTGLLVESMFERTAQ